MFASISTGVRVGVTTTVSKKRPEPKIICNYNGGFREKLGSKSVLRYQRVEAY
jgi:hypothetical protein